MKQKLMQVTLDLYEADIINLALDAYCKRPDVDPDDLKLLEQWGELVDHFSVHTCQEDGYEA